MSKTKKNTKKNNNKTGYFLITRGGLELTTLVKQTKMCYVVDRPSVNKSSEYCYKTRFIIDPSESDIKLFGLKK
tara:strand:+ start:442 stop:663 length:222 start_codon:yes stop_codon:yes gene_type:complete